MAAPKGNKYWQFRDKHGKEPKYDPEPLWNKFYEYAEWVCANPLMEAKLVSYQGVSKIEEMPHLRAMTIAGFCLFADITERTWQNYKNNEDYFPVTTRIEKAIYVQKFEGAAAEFLNANIIARDLGLVEKKELTGKEGKDLFTGLTDAEIEAKIIEYEKQRNK